MALTYEWKLTGLKKQHTDTLDNVIIGTQWKVTGTDEDGFSGVFVGATPFEISQINTGSFVAYAELTEEDVLGWVKNYVSGSTLSNYMPHINQQIERQISHKRYSVKDVDDFDFPWAPTSGSRTTESIEPAPYV